MNAADARNGIFVCSNWRQDQIGDENSGEQGEKSDPFYKTLILFPCSLLQVCGCHVHLLSHSAWFFGIVSTLRGPTTLLSTRLRRCRRFRRSARQPIPCLPDQTRRNGALLLPSLPRHAVQCLQRLFEQFPGPASTSYVAPPSFAASSSLPLVSNAGRASASAARTWSWPGGSSAWSQLQTVRCR